MKEVDPPTLYFRQNLISISIKSCSAQGRSDLFSIYIYIFFGGEGGEGGEGEPLVKA